MDRLSVWKVRSCVVAKKTRIIIAVTMLQQGASVEVDDFLLVSDLILSPAAARANSISRCHCFEHDSVMVGKPQCGLLNIKGVLRHAASLRAQVGCLAPSRR